MYHPNFLLTSSSHQLSCVVDNICLWKALNLEDVHRSDMLQLILEKVDIRMCILQPSSDPRLTHTYCRLVNFFHAANCNYVGKAFRTMASEATTSRVCFCAMKETQTIYL